MKLLKHIGQLKDTQSRIILLFKSVPDEKDMALVCQVDTLPDLVREEFMELVENKECQASTDDLGVYLSRKTLRSAGAAGQSALNWLHQVRKIEKVATNKVVMVPHPSTHILLSDILKEMSSLNSSENASKENTKEANTVKETKKEEIEDVQISNKLVKATTDDEKRKVAENLLIEAKLLREDAERAAKAKEKQAKSILAEVKETDNAKKAGKKTKA